MFINLSFLVLATHISEEHTPSNVDNTIKTSVSNGDTTASVKTGDDALAGTLAGLALLSIAGTKVLKKKEND